MSNDPRCLVTINGRVVTDSDLIALGQTWLATRLERHGIAAITGPHRSEFVDKVAAQYFHGYATSEFPEDDVCLWTLVPTESEQ